MRAAYYDWGGNYHEAEYSWNSAGIDHTENFDISNGKETINVDSDGKRRQFRFFPSGTEPFDKDWQGNITTYYPYTINHYSSGHESKDSSAVQGIVADTTQDDYPVLKDGYTDTTVGADKVNTDKSLAYLFDPTISDNDVPGRTSYTGLNHLFYMDGGYYTFNSADYYAFLDVQNGIKDFSLYNLGTNNSGAALKYPGFFR